MPYSEELGTSSRKQKTSKGLKGKALSWQEDIRESTENGNHLYVGEEAIMDYKKQSLENMVYKNEDLVKHGRNLPSYLQYGGKDKNTQDKTFNFGVLDWNRLEKWKFKTKCITKSSLSSDNLATEGGSARPSTSINNISHLDQRASNGSQIHSSCRERPPKEKPTKVQSSETVHGLQISCWNDLSSESNGQQTEQMIVPRRESFSHDTMRSHSSMTKMQTEENIGHDHDLRLNGQKDVIFSFGDSHAISSHELSLSESTEPLDRTLAEVNLSFEALQSFPFPLGIKRCPVEIKDAPLKDISLIENKSAVEPLTTDEYCKNVDLNSVQPPSVITGRHSSFSKRFSFSIEKMATSFSFRKNSAFLQLNSTYKSFGSSPDLHDYNMKKGNAIATNIVKSISTRLLHPLLNHKGPHSAKKIQQSNRNLISNDKQQKSSNLHALLHLTMKNGIPFFKLVVNNSSSNILSASVKKLPSGKDDSSLIYTFHSLNETKKKNGGWKKNQFLTEKSCGFDYNIVGKMKISSSYHAEFSGLERDLFVVRESVLYGPDCMPNAELATIIVKNISNENYGGIGNSKSTVVILPGGVHGLPNGGKPSSLINRWRSGGACDCGGWDIGCELRVLTNEIESMKISNQSSVDRLDLCYQGMHNNKLALSLAPLENGLYSLEYNASISLLQAFSICVAVVSSQNLTHIFQVNHLQDAKDFSKPITSYEKVENQTIEHAKIPPSSPIGRV